MYLMLIPGGSVGPKRALRVERASPAPPGHLFLAQPTPARPTSTRRWSLIGLDTCRTGTATASRRPDTQELSALAFQL
jgi:hypothetical protein